MKPQTFDHERVSFNLARLKKAGHTFEVAVDPDAAILYKTKKQGDLHDILKSERRIFTNVSHGQVAGEKELHIVFGTDDVLKIAEIILNEGEIQLTEEYRKQLKEKKYKRLVSLIATHAIDPKTKFPHPPQRIQNALEEAKVHLDDFKSADEQVEEVVKKLQPILPIKFATKVIHVHIPAEHSPKAQSIIRKYGKPKQEEWMNDGSFSCMIEIPAGLEPELYDKLNAATHGNIETKVVG